MIWGLRIVAILTITCGACAFEHHMLDENNILLIFLHNFGSKGQISLDFLLLKVSWLVSNGVGPDPVEGVNTLCWDLFPTSNLFDCLNPVPKATVGVKFPCVTSQHLGFIYLGRM